MVALARKWRHSYIKQIRERARLDQMLAVLRTKKEVIDEEPATYYCDRNRVKQLHDNTSQ